MLVDALSTPKGDYTRKLTGLLSGSVRSRFDGVLSIGIFEIKVKARSVSRTFAGVVLLGSHNSNGHGTLTRASDVRKVTP